MSPTRLSNLSERETRMPAGEVATAELPLRGKELS